MSRIGKKPVQIPEGVKVGCDMDTVTVEGPKGKMCQRFHESMKIEIVELYIKEFIYVYD